MSLPEGETAWDAVGFVLAGGRSSRMGEDKSLLQVGGETLVARALRILLEAGLAARIAGAASPLGAFGAVVEDARPGLGPLGGICAALASTGARLAVFLPVDLPMLPAALVECLLDHARITGRAITVASVNGFAQTFPAVVDRGAGPALEAELAAGRGGCFSGFQAAAASLGQAVSVVPVELLVQSGQVAHPAGLPAARWFLNVNTPEDLRQANESPGRGHRVS